jgi:hypothetical protein
MKNAILWAIMSRSSKKAGILEEYIKGPKSKISRKPTEACEKLMVIIYCLLVLLA